MSREEKHAAQRDAIARATWAVLLRDGVRGASVRAVLAESGMSSGAMRYYFADHNELLVFAAEHALQQATARVQRLLEDDTLTGRERARAVLAEVLPLDETRALEVVVFVRLAEIHDGAGRGERTRRAAYDGIRSLAYLAVAELERQVSPAAALAEAERLGLTEWLHLAVDGLAFQFAMYPGLLSFADVGATLERLLDRLDDQVRAALPRTRRPR